MTRKHREPIRTCVIDGFSERLQQATFDSGLTNTEICKRARIDRNSLFNYISGFMPVSDKLARLAVVLNVSTDYLLGLSDEKELKK